MGFFKNAGLYLGLIEEVEQEQTREPLPIPAGISMKEASENLSEAGRMLRNFNLKDEHEEISKQERSKHLRQIEREKKKEKEKVENEKRGKYFKNLLEGYNRHQGRKQSQLLSKMFPRNYGEAFHGDTNNVEHKLQLQSLNSNPVNV